MAALDLADTRQRALDRIAVGIVGAEIETYPGLPIALEPLDVPGAERGGLGAGVELRGDLQIQFCNACVFVQAIDGLAGGEAGTGKQQGDKGKQQGCGLESHKS
ncbi:hypothetical protein D3C78_748350 [compost metagenome]